MYNAFRKMINDIFNNENFIQFCYINGIQYKCLVSSVEDGMLFTEAGRQNLENFTLEVQITEQNINNLPKENDKIIFRHKEYKVAHFDLDSTLSTIKLYIVSNSRGK